MNITLITVGTRLPAWVDQGCREYHKRLVPNKVNLIEIAVVKRGKNVDINRLVAKEGDKMLAAIPKGAWVVALDEKGQNLSSTQLAQQLAQWQQQGQPLCFLIGGPDGLDQRCLTRADWTFAISTLTFPHALARLILLEQLYRAQSILQGSPYHRN